MLTYLLFCFVLAPQATTPTTASELIGRMFVRYNSAKTLGGTIRTTQVAGSASVVTETNLAYERPSKLFLDQRQTVGERTKEKILISDGKVFRYTPPDRLITATPFVTETVKPDERPAQTVGDLYHIVAVDLPDRSPVLDALIALREDLGYFKNQLASFHLAGKETIGGKAVNVIEGNWRETEVLSPAGTFKLYITDTGDLVRYVLVQSFAPPAAQSRNGQAIPGGDPITVTTTWDASIIVDGLLKPDSFTFRPR